VTVRKREGGFGEAKNQRVWPGAESAGVRGGRDPGGGAFGGRTGGGHGKGLEDTRGYEEHAAGPNSRSEGKCPHHVHLPYMGPLFGLRATKAKEAIWPKGRVAS